MRVVASVSEANLRAIIADVAGADIAASLALDQTFDEAGIDSLEHGQILIRLEEDYQVTIADEDFERCNSIGAILGYVGR